MSKIYLSCIKKMFFFYNATSLIVIRTNNHNLLIALSNVNPYYIRHSILKTLNVWINPNLNSIHYLLFYRYPLAFTLIKRWNFFLKFVFIFFFKKIKFTGKGYYLYKTKRNTLGLQFNYSHKVNVYFFHSHIFKYSKRSWFFFNLNRSVLISSLKKLKHWRPINVFTGRGMRFTHELVYIKKKK